MRSRDAAEQAPARVSRDGRRPGRGLSRASDRRDRACVCLRHPQGVQECECLDDRGKGDSRPGFDLLHRCDRRRVVSRPGGQVYQSSGLSDRSWLDVAYMFIGDAFSPQALTEGVKPGAVDTEACPLTSWPARSAIVTTDKYMLQVLVIVLGVARSVGESGKNKQ